MPVSAHPIVRARGAAVAWGWILVTLLTLVVVALAIAGACDPAFAQAGPFGVAAPEAGGAVPHNGVFGWIAARQSEFYRGLTAGLRQMRTNPHAGWWLIALSFAYGIFHAAGPGHGKAVITSYVLANHQTLKRGIVLSFISALLQGVVAVVVVCGSIAIFHFTALQLTDATMALEHTSAVAILVLGLWLVWTKIIVRFRAATVEASARGVAREEDVVDCVIGGGARPASASAALCGCGDAHVADPAMLQGPFDLRRALTTVAAVGIRPCTGALIVLVFASSQGLVEMGVVSVLAMALGTGITVAALAALAVMARGFALRIAGDDDVWSQRILRSAEIGGALMVLVMGVLLTGASFLGGGGAG